MRKNRKKLRKSDLTEETKQWMEEEKRRYQLLPWRREAFYGWHWLKRCGCYLWGFRYWKRWNPKQYNTQRMFVPRTQRVSGAWLQGRGQHRNREVDYGIEN